MTLKNAHLIDENGCVNSFIFFGGYLKRVRAAIKTTMDAIEACSESVAFTRTACRGVYDHDRGKTDEQIRAVAQSGGYIGIVAVPYFLRQGEEVTLSDMLDHIDVGIGGDWPGRWYPESLAVKHNEECESAAQMAVHGFSSRESLGS